MTPKEAQRRLVNACFHKSGHLTTVFTFFFFFLRSDRGLSEVVDFILSPRVASSSSPNRRCVAKRSVRCERVIPPSRALDCVGQLAFVPPCTSRGLRVFFISCRDAVVRVASLIIPLQLFPPPPGRPDGCEPAVSRTRVRCCATMRLARRPEKSSVVVVVVYAAHRRRRCLLLLPGLRGPC